MDDFRYHGVLPKATDYRCDRCASALSSEALCDNRRCKHGRVTLALTRVDPYSLEGITNDNPLTHT